MQAVLLTDTHLGIKNSNKMWLDLTYNLFKDITDYCLLNNINKIIHLGDWFNSRYSINILTLSYAYKIVEMLDKNNIHIHICIGNHDQYYKNQPNPHSLMIFNEFDNVHIIDKPTEYDDEIICPWNTLPDNTDKKILFGHYEINNIVTNASGNTLTGSKLSITDFKQFDKVYSGHFHTKSSTSNIEYIGSAFSMDFNDVGDTRGYYHYDSGKIIDFIEYIDAPKFKQFTSGDDFDKIDIKGNICKLVFLKSYSEKKSLEIIDVVKSYEPKELHINFKVDTDDTVEESFIGTNSEIMGHYINSIMILPDGLSKKTLKSYVNQLEKSIT